MPSGSNHRTGFAGRAFQGAAVLVVSVAALLLAWPVITVNLARACVVNDTPYLPLCPAGPVQAQTLRARLAADPGEAPGYIELARLTPTAPVIGAARRLAPTHPQVQLMTATEALRREDLKAAMPALIEMAEYHAADDRSAPLILARLVIAGRTALLEPYLKPESTWPTAVLGQMNNAGGSMASALPLISKALAAKALDPAAVSGYVARLKSAGAWGDAYALWLTLHSRPVPLLYNGSFDDPFLADGFDWEENTETSIGRAGALASRIGWDDRGAVLNVRLTGRKIATPIIRQYVFANPGTYRLKGEYRSRQLRLDKGLAWTIRCTADTVAVAGTSEPLTDTGDVWKPFEVAFSLPPGCGAVAIVQLETVSTTDALAGGHGEAWFDALALERLAN